MSALDADKRCVAAWLISSMGRGDAGSYSDIDLVAVVAVPHAGALCARPWRSAARATPERLNLIRRFGTPAIVHEAHVNAPAGATHTNVLFADGARLDLTLVPFERAERPANSRLLFEKVHGPPAPLPPESPEERRELAAQRMALFWIIAIGAAQYQLRGWDVAVHAMLTALRGQVDDVRPFGAPDRLVALLDFDDAHETFPLADVAVLLDTWGVERTDYRFEPSQARRALDAYIRRRPLATAAWDLLPDVMALDNLADATSYVIGCVEQGTPAAQAVADCGQYDRFHARTAAPDWPDHVRDQLALG